jgi:hypothetical protein
MSLRWDPCVMQYGNAFEHFLFDFLDQPTRKCLVIGGSGFDPRATLVPGHLSKLKQAKIRGLFFREERPSPQPKLRQQADAHQRLILGFLPNSVFPELQIFADGKTVTGGRRAVEAVRAENLGGVTDIIVDISALSSGVLFPIVRYCLQICDQTSKTKAVVNLHLFTVEEPKFDYRIRAIPGDTVSWAHGYRSEESLEAAHDKAVLWLPTLAPGCGTVLNRIHSSLSRSSMPMDVCPIVPFPSHDPRMPDKLVEEYREVLTQWKTDTQSLLYAAESDPLDSYRTICSICTSRDRTFKDITGSIVILSPVGNKLLAVGAMLAAIERDLPVALVESVGYDDDIGEITKESCDSLQINHIWLAGEAYAERP